MGGLPGALVLAAHIGPVDELVVVGRRAQYLHHQGGLGHGLEAHRHLAELETDVGDMLPRLHGDGVQVEGVVAAGEQVGRQQLVVGAVVGLVQHLVIQARAVGAGGQHGGPGGVGGNAVVPVELRERHVGGVGDGEVVPHLAARQRLGVAPFGDGDAQLGGLVVVGQLDDLARNGGVLPHDLHGPARLDVNGLVLLVQLVPRGRLQLADVQPTLALHGEVVDIDIPLVVRAVLADGVLVLVIHQEPHAVNSLLGDGINLAG